MSIENVEVVMKVVDASLSYSYWAGQALEKGGVAVATEIFNEFEGKVFNPYGGCLGPGNEMNDIREKEVTLILSEIAIQELRGAIEKAFVGGKVVRAQVAQIGRIAEAFGIQL